MLKSIYKITNTINQKVYIGQSIHPIQRFSEHCYNNTDSLIHRAIKKYGKENFQFEIIEPDIENYNEREKYWINYYNCISPNGYNLSHGGDEPPIISKEKNHFSTHSIEDVALVKKLLKDSDLSVEEIAAETGYSDSSGVYRINAGIIWREEGEDYPIRKAQMCKSVRDERIRQVQNYLLNTDLTQKEIGKICNLGRTAVTAINLGANGFNENLTYPLRKGRHYNKNL